MYGFPRAVQRPKRAAPAAMSGRLFYASCPANADRFGEQERQAVPGGQCIALSSPRRRLQRRRQAEPKNPERGHYPVSKGAGRRRVSGTSADGTASNPVSRPKGLVGLGLQAFRSFNVRKCRICAGTSRQRTCQHSRHVAQGDGAAQHAKNRIYTTEWHAVGSTSPG